MTPVWWMVGLSLVSWLVVAGLLGRDTGLAALAGLLAPLAVAAGSWIVMERTHRRNPGALTRVILRAFVGKMIFFGAYVAIVLSALSIRPVPFVVSFTAYFICLHVMEAICLRRLLAGGLQS
jgi:hypothetical protein